MRGYSLRILAAECVGVSGCSEILLFRGLMEQLCPCFYGNLAYIPLSSFGIVDAAMSPVTFGVYGEYHPENPRQEWETGQLCFACSKILEDISGTRPAYYNAWNEKT